MRGSPCGIRARRPAIPVHLKWPITLTNGALETVEQDTLEEVTQNLQILWSTPTGFFLHDPELGVESPLFSQLPVDTDDLLAAAAEFEERAAVEFDTADEDTDTLAAQGQARVSVRVSLAEEG